MLIREIIRWVWLLVCLADFMASCLVWVELRKRNDRTFLYIARIMFADAFRAVVSGMGLYLYGVNEQSRLWFLLLGLASVLCQGMATAGFLLFWRGILNGGGVWELVKRVAEKRVRVGK